MSRPPIRNGLSNRLAAGQAESVDFDALPGMQDRPVVDTKTMDVGLRAATKIANPTAGAAPARLSAPAGAKGADVKAHLGRVLTSLTRGRVTSIEKFVYFQGARRNELERSLNTELATSSGGRLTHWTQLLSSAGMRVMQNRSAQPTDGASPFAKQVDRSNVFNKIDYAGNKAIINNVWEPLGGLLKAVGLPQLDNRVKFAAKDLERQADALGMNKQDKVVKVTDLATNVLFAFGGGAVGKMGKLAKLPAAARAAIGFGVIPAIQRVGSDSSNNTLNVGTFARAGVDMVQGAWVAKVGGGRVAKQIAAATTAQVARRAAEGEPVTPGGVLKTAILSAATVAGMRFGRPHSTSLVKSKDAAVSARTALHGRSAMAELRDSVKAYNRLAPYSGHATREAAAKRVMAAQQSLNTLRDQRRSEGHWTVADKQNYLEVMKAHGARADQIGASHQRGATAKPGGKPKAGATAAPPAESARSSNADATKNAAKHLDNPLLQKLYEQSTQPDRVAQTRENIREMSTRELVGAAQEPENPKQATEPVSPRNEMALLTPEAKVWLYKNPAVPSEGYSDNLAKLIGEARGSAATEKLHSFDAFVQGIAKLSPARQLALQKHLEGNSKKQILQLLEVQFPGDALTGAIKVYSAFDKLGQIGVLVNTYFGLPANSLSGVLRQFEPETESWLYRDASQPELGLSVRAAKIKSLIVAQSESDRNKKFGEFLASWKRLDHDEQFALKSYLNGDSHENIHAKLAKRYPDSLMGTKVLFNKRIQKPEGVIGAMVKKYFGMTTSELRLLGGVLIPEVSQWLKSRPARHTDGSATHGELLKALMPAGVSSVGDTEAYGGQRLNAFRDAIAQRPEDEQYLFMNYVGGEPHASLDQLLLQRYPESLLITKRGAELFQSHAGRSVLITKEFFGLSPAKLREALQANVSPPAIAGDTTPSRRVSEKLRKLLPAIGEATPAGYPADRVEKVSLEMSDYKVSEADMSPATKAWHESRQLAQAAYLQRQQALAEQGLSALSRQAIDARFMNQLSFATAKGTYDRGLASGVAPSLQEALHEVFGTSTQVGRDGAEMAYAHKLVAAVQYGMEFKRHGGSQHDLMLHQSMVGAQMQAPMRAATRQAPYVHVIAHAPGLGKTYTALAALKQARAKRVLISAPPTARKNVFVQEIAQAFPDTVVLHDKKQVDSHWKRLEAKRAAGQPIRIDKNVVLTSRAAVVAQTEHELRVSRANEAAGQTRSASDPVSGHQVFYLVTSDDFSRAFTTDSTSALHQRLTENLRHLGVDALVVDESHSLRTGGSPNTMHRTLTEEFAALARIRIGLTGTPVVNRQQDLVDQIELLSTVQSGSVLRPSIQAPPDRMSAEEVNAFAAGHVDRLTAAEAGQRPPPVATITETPMSAQQWADQERITADPTLGHIEKINQLKALELQAKLPAAREAVVDAMLNNKKVLIFTLLEEAGATSAHAQMRKSLKQEPRLVERYGAGVGQAVDDALGLHTGQSPMNERDVTLQRFRQVGVRDGRAPMNAMFATYGTFKESTTAFDPKQLAQRYTVVALGLPWDKATLDQAVARLDRVGNRVGVDLLVPITSAPESATSKLTLSQAIYYGYVAPKEGIANAALGDAPRDAKATPKRLLADLTRLTPDQLGMFLESGKLSPQELAAYLTSDRGADYYGVNARVRIHTALHHDIATQIARQAAGSNTVLIDLGGGDGALGARLKKLGPHLSSMTVDVLPQGHPLIQDKSRHLSADIGQPLRSKVENRLQSLGQSSAPRVVVWNMSLLGFKSGQQSSLAERLKIGADLLRAGETAYIGDVNSIVKALPKGELQNAAEQAGLKIEKVRLLERDDAGIPGVVFRFTKR